jgi:hypothetical protein
MLSSKETLLTYIKKAFKPILNFGTGKFIPYFFRDFLNPYSRISASNLQIGHYRLLPNPSLDHIPVSFDAI